MIVVYGQTLGIIENMGNDEFQASTLRLPQFTKSGAF